MTTETTQAIRRAGLEDAPQIAALFRLAYAESSHPCKSEEFVTRTIRRKRTDIWYVSHQDGIITGCMGMLAQPWNRTWEIGRGVVHPEFRRGGLATTLAQRALDHASSSEDCDIISGFPRNRAMYRIVSEMIEPALRVTGHDGGINVADGKREYHLAGFAFPGHERMERIIPDQTLKGAVAVLHLPVMQAFGLPGKSGEYPPILIAGEYPKHPDYGPFAFYYHPFCPSDSLEISAYTGPKQHARDVAADLVQTLESFRYARHVRLAVLADKVEFQRELRAGGFKITAYLPAWYLLNGVRYDCVLMVRRNTEGEPVDHGIRELIDYFNGIYESNA